jgi:predicted aspartyl protease
MRGIAMMAAYGAAISAPAFALPSQVPAPLSAPEEQVIATRNDASDRMTVPVSIAGKGPYHFVVDTGADRTVISRELASALALKPGGSVNMLSMGSVDRVETAIIENLDLSTNRIFDIRAPILAEANLSAQGMLGTDSLRSKRVVMDFKAGHMTIVEAEEPEQRFTNEIVVTAKRRFGQLILVNADIEGEPLAVIVDTGSQATIGNAALRRKLLQAGALDKTRLVSLISVMGVEIPASYTQIRRVRIGGVTVNNMPVAFADAKPFHALGLTDRPALLLGMDVLRTFDRVSIDFANKRVRFLLPTQGANVRGAKLASR